MAAILLCGFSGSGKSTFLQKMGPPSHEFTLIDLDQYIYQSHVVSHASLGDFIRKEGINRFRELEYMSLKQILSSIKQNQIFIIALGGGALNDTTEKLLKQHNEIYLVWLDTPFDLCWQRVRNDQNRPLAEMGEQKMQQLYDERLPFYKKASWRLTLDLQYSLKTKDDLLQYIGLKKTR